MCGYRYAYASVFISLIWFCWLHVDVVVVVSVVLCQLQESWMEERDGDSKLHFTAIFSNDLRFKIEGSECVWEWEEDICRVVATEKPNQFTRSTPEGAMVVVNKLNGWLEFSINELN